MYHQYQDCKIFNSILLYGPNGCGKTNLYRLYRHLLDDGVKPLYMYADLSILGDVLDVLSDIIAEKKPGVLNRQHTPL